LLHLDTVDSTNLEAMRRFQAGELGPLWIWADQQTAGRGRLGRLWQSPPGNLYATLLWQDQAPQSAASQIGFVAALAVHDAVIGLRPDSELKLKWPNDLLMNGGKLCGLLCETLQASPLVLTVGFGINLASAPVGLSYKTASLGEDVPASLMLERLVAAFVNRLGQWQSGRGFPGIRDDWCLRSFPAGTQMSVNGRNGRYAGLDASGAFLFHDAAGKINIVHAGDIQVVPRFP
jgi:BirA family biotin operon repressor/biotin-[acetyl-CoA-carboxylase] ligase